MFLPVLKRAGILVFISALWMISPAQQNYFVYLQTENGQPFYVKVNNKVVSSSSAGYLILPKLTEGDYKLSVGFPKKEFPEEDFQILIDKKNQGFLLKNFGEKGWGLFNMQSLQVIMGGNINTIASGSKNLQDDPFSKLLANVVKDSSILQKNESPKVAVPPAVKVDSTAIVAAVPPAVKADSPTVVAAKPVPLKDDSIIAAAEKPSASGPDSAVTIIEKPAQHLSPATRFFNKRNKDGREMIYIDHNAGVNDTIRIFIPLRKVAAKAGSTDSSSIGQNLKALSAPHTDSSVVVAADSSMVQKQVPPAKPVTDTASAVIEQRLAPAEPDPGAVVSSGTKKVADKDTALSEKMAEVQQPGIHLQNSATQPANKAAEVKDEGTKKDDMVVLPRVVRSSALNSDCKGFATNEDFLKLRKKMAAETSDDNMIKIAKKAFHLKCFSTEQIKNISFLFLTNAGKYMFFDIAYPFAADSEQYQSLESQLTDSYYINRFKAMIHK